MTTSATHSNIANYESEWSAQEYTRERGLRADEARLVTEFFPKPPAKVLDLGCGAGRTTVGLAERGYDVVAVDLSDQLLELARRNHPTLDFRKMDATRLEFGDEEFDVVLFSYNGIDCVRPVSDRIRCMAEAHRVLKPGGAFVLSSHNLVGSIFSGGFFYLAGYWNAAKLLADQVANPAAWRWFIRYRDGGGPQLLYSAPPSRTVKQLEGVGFKVECVRGFTGEENARRIFWRQQHVHFVARKPQP